MHWGQPEFILGAGRGQRSGADCRGSPSFSHRTRDDLKEAVKAAVKHEIGHYFGLNDGRLEELMDE
jgi:Zincin-like metallopeptidase